MSIEQIALGTRKGLMIFQKDRNGNWDLQHHAFRGSHVSIVHFDPRTGNLFACLDDGHFGNKMFRWNAFADCDQVSQAKQTDVWQELPTLAYPEGSKLHDGRDAVLKYQWAFAHGTENQPGRIYVGTEPGGLFFSDDDGDSFQFVQSLWDHPTRCDVNIPWMGGGRDDAGIHSICIDPRDDKCLRIGISVAGVYQTNDGMASWQVANNGLKAEFLPDPDSELGHDPHLMAQCRSNPDVLWQQNHCGIFRTENGGDQWECISEENGVADFGFCIVADPGDEKVAWVVPAESDQVRIACDRQLVVSRTDNGGKSWHHFRNGLPQENCFDFSFRHGLVLSGNSLIFGTACGSLYESNDRGESWNAIFHHLPPVYCVHIIEAN